MRRFMYFRNVHLLLSESDFLFCYFKAINWSKSHQLKWHHDRFVLSRHLYLTISFTRVHIQGLNVTSLSATDVSPMTKNRLKSRHSEVNYSLWMSEQQSDVVVVVVFLFDTSNNVTGDGTVRITNALM